LFCTSSVHFLTGAAINYAATLQDERNDVLAVIEMLLVDRSSAGTGAGAGVGDGAGTGAGAGGSKTGTVGGAGGGIGGGRALSAAFAPSIASIQEIAALRAENDKLSKLRRNASKRALQLKKDVELQRSAADIAKGTVLFPPL
jgi:hypothetical protein